MVSCLLIHFSWACLRKNSEMLPDTSNDVMSQDYRYQSALCIRKIAFTFSLRGLHRRAITIHDVFIDQGTNTNSVTQFIWTHSETNSLYNWNLYNKSSPSFTLAKYLDTWCNLIKKLISLLYLQCCDGRIPLPVLCLFLKPRSNALSGLNRKKQFSRHAQQ